jgi:K+ transporter
LVLNVFSLTQQSIQLGFLPRMQIRRLVSAAARRLRRVFDADLGQRHYGFMQYPTIYEELILACKQGKLPGIDLTDITYYKGRETIIPRGDIPGTMGIAGVAVRVPAAQRRTDGGILRGPARQAVEFGTEIEI